MIIYSCVEKIYSRAKTELITHRIFYITIYVEISNKIFLKFILHMCSTSCYKPVPNHPPESDSNPDNGTNTDINNGLDSATTEDPEAYKHRVSPVYSLKIYNNRYDVLVMLRFAFKTSETTINNSENTSAYFKPSTMIFPNGNTYHHPKDFPSSQKYKENFPVIMNNPNIVNPHIYEKTHFTPHSPSKISNSKKITSCFLSMNIEHGFSSK